MMAVPRCRIFWVFLVVLLAISGCSRAIRGTNYSFKTDRPALVVPAKPDAIAEGLGDVLLAEIAGQRGDYAQSLEIYLNTSRAWQQPEIIARTARIAFYVKDIDAAEEMSALWLTRDPGSSEAHLYAVLLALWQERPDEAFSQFEVYWELTEASAHRGTDNIIQSVKGEDQQRGLLKLLNRLVQERPKDSLAFYFYAYAAQNFSQLILAADLLEKAIVIDPDNRSMIGDYFLLMTELGRAEQSLVFVRDLLAQRPDLNVTRLVYANMLADRNMLVKATAQYRLLLKQQPDNEGLRFSLALLLLRQEKLDEAQGFFSRLVCHERYGGEAMYYLGNIAEQQEDYQKASDWYKQVSRKTAYYLDARVRLALNWSRLGKERAAFKLLENTPTTSLAEEQFLKGGKAQIFYQQKQYIQALHVYDGLVKASPTNNSTQWLYARAMVAERLNQLDVVEEDLRQLLRHNPNNLDALNALGFILADKTDRHDEAYVLIKRAYAINPSISYVIDSLGWVLYRMGNLVEALAYLKEAFGKNPQPEIAAHLGEVLWQLDRKEEAKKLWHRKLKDFPGNDLLEEVVQRFLK